jgi:hypothetical protein
MWTYCFDARNNLSILRNGLAWSDCTSRPDKSPAASAIESAKHIMDLVPGMLEDALTTEEKVSILKMAGDATADIKKVLEEELTKP